MTTRALVRIPLGLATLTVATLASWWAWLGWDDRYQYVNGVAGGPFEAWQVAGCTVCLAVLAFVGGARLGVPWTAAVITVAFTAQWIVWASARDGDGLWPIGAGMLAVGLGTGATVLALLGRAVRSRRQTRPATAPC